MLRMKNKTQTTTHTPTAAEAQDRIQGVLGSKYLIEVPEQNPLSIGHDLLYRSRVTTVETGEERILHIALPDQIDDEELDSVELREIAFPLNPFRSVISIEDAVS